MNAAAPASRNLLAQPSSRLYVAVSPALRQALMNTVGADWASTWPMAAVVMSVGVNCRLSSVIDEPSAGL